ncbi:MAG: Spy/CpxP family protein refolding chaperone [Burkholderiaceae bacterium]
MTTPHESDRIQPTMPADDAGPTTPPKRWTRWALAGAALAGVLTVGACSHQGWSRHGDDPAERVERAVDRIFSRVDATDEQKARINEIANGALREMGPMREQLREARGQAITALTGATVDRTTLERLRTEQVASLEKRSAVVSAALADIAEVLTPEQREQARERLSRHEGRRHWF